MFLSMNLELRLAHEQQEMAQSHAARGSLERTTIYTDKATKHLDRHDVIMVVVNNILLYEYNDKIDRVNPDFPSTLEAHENQYGPVPTTVLERVRSEDLLRMARNNATSTTFSAASDELCQSFAASMGTPSL